MSPLRFTSPVLCRRTRRTIPVPDRLSSMKERVFTLVESFKSSRLIDYEEDEDKKATNS
jgi:hypothetical protein